MNKFIKKTLLFLFILLVIDKAFIIFRPNETNIFSEFAQKKMQKISPKYLSHQAFNILVTGSSHTQFGVSPEIITAETGRVGLNIAFGGGANMGLQLLLLKNILKKEKHLQPKLILFGMDAFTMNAAPLYSDESLDMLIQNTNGFSTFIHSKVFYSYCRLYGQGIPAYITQVKKGDWCLPLFSSKHYYNLSMFLHFEKIEISDLGWVKGYGTLNKSYLRYSKMVFQTDIHSEEDLLEYISLCKENNIRLIFFQVPEHISCLAYHKKYDDFNVYFQKITKESGISYLDYNNMHAYPVNTDSLFFDSDHLNFRGAELFSHRLAKDIALLVTE